MASSLPTFPRIVFTIIEPISLVAGFAGAVIDPVWFIGEQSPQKNDGDDSPNSIVIAWQLGNLYLLLALIGVAILSTTTETRVVRSYLVALWLADIGHVVFSSYGIGRDRLLSPLQWNAMTGGNVGMMLFLFFTRTFYLTGFFGPDHVNKSAKKTA